MKTILIPIYNGFVARNFFYTDVYRELADAPETRLVIVVPSSKYDYYRREFPEKNVLFESLDGIAEPRFGEILSSFAFNLLRTRTVWFRQKDRYMKFGNYPNFLLKRAINFFLGPFIFPRRVLRWLDRFVASNSAIDALMEKYKTNLLLAPDAAFGIDKVFLRSAKRHGIRTIGMVRSWDNLTSKGTIQILPDILILHTERMKRQVIKYAGMPARNIVVTGPSEYDAVFCSLPVSREEFMKKIGADPLSKLVLFAPFYDRFTGSAVIMINDLINAIEDGRLPKNTHILIRYRPDTPDIPEGAIKKSAHVSISKPCSHVFPIQTKIMLARKDWEFTKSDVDLFHNSLRFCDVMINTFSTFTIDAIAYDKPTIGIRFDADSATPPLSSVTHVPDRHDHYRELEATKGVKLVYSMNELVNGVHDYFLHPEKDGEGRQRMRDEQIQFFDGMNGKRVAEAIKKEFFVDKEQNHLSTEVSPW